MTLAPHIKAPKLEHQKPKNLGFAHLNRLHAAAAAYEKHEAVVTLADVEAFLADKSSQWSRPVTMNERRR